MSPVLLGASSGDENFVSFDVPIWAWVALVAVISALLFADLLIVHRKPHVITFKEAAIESGGVDHASVSRSRS